MNISLDRLDPHPETLNRMSDKLLAKLVAQIRETARYPALIVRSHPRHHDRYEILDGCHRAEALRRLGRRSARCDLWPVDDDQARRLLLTLNRLRGRDDPHRRSIVLRKLSEVMNLNDLARHLPEDASRLRRLMEIGRPAPRPVPPPDVSDLPHAVTFFLTAPQRSRLLGELKRLGGDRSEALVRLLQLEQEHQGASSADQ